MESFEKCKYAYKSWGQQTNTYQNSANSRDTSEDYV